MNKLQRILEAYRNGERDLPGYAELMEIAQDASQPMRREGQHAAAITSEMAQRHQMLSNPMHTHAAHSIGSGSGKEVA